MLQTHEPRTEETKPRLYSGLVVFLTANVSSPAPSERLGEWRDIQLVEICNLTAANNSTHLTVPNPLCFSDQNRHYSWTMHEGALHYMWNMMKNYENKRNIIINLTFPLKPIDLLLKLAFLPCNLLSDILSPQATWWLALYMCNHDHEVSFHASAVSFSLMHGSTVTCVHWAQSATTTWGIKQQHCSCSWCSAAAVIQPAWRSVTST